ncbi:MAG: TetR/AcrR family transcriptional regulator [Alphaproteobacteria bacterium]
MSSGEPDTRTKILNAAWQLLESGDASAVRMGDIAKAAGISRQAVYLHFPSRADLLVATVRHIDAVKQVDARLEASRNATDSLSRLDALIDAWAAYIPEIHGVCSALIAMKKTDPAAKAAFDDRMAALRHGCEAAVRDMRHDGVLTDRYTDEQATDILWTIVSLDSWERLVTECGWTQEQYANETKRLARLALSSG